MNDQGAEDQVPEPPGLEGRGELPPRPTVRESFRRGLFVRLPTEAEAEEGLPGAEQSAEESTQGLADQYPEQVADPYPGWRQAADGSWEAVSPEAQSYVESAEPVVPAAYPEVDQGADFASVAGGEPFIHADAEAPAWTFAQEQELAPTGEDVPAFEPAPEEAAPETAPEVIADPTLEPQAETPPEQEYVPADEIAPADESLQPQEPEAAPEPAFVPEATPEAIAEPVAEDAFAPAEPVAEEVATPAEVEPVLEPAASPELVAEATAAPEAAAPADDPVAGTGLYIPGDVEYLEGDMPLYSEQDKVPPRFAGSGLGEPFFIEFGDLARTLTGLRGLLPKGTRLTYNYDYERAWVRTSAEIDLPSFAERIEAAAEEGEKASS